MPIFDDLRVQAFKYVKEKCEEKNCGDDVTQDKVDLYLMEILNATFMNFYDEETSSCIKNFDYVFPSDINAGIFAYYFTCFLFEKLKEAVETNKGKEHASRLWNIVYIAKKYYENLMHCQYCTYRQLPFSLIHPQHGDAYFEEDVLYIERGQSKCDEKLDEKTNSEISW